MIVRSNSYKSFQCCFFIAFSLQIVCVSIIFAINYLVFHYKGNNYLPEGSFQAAFSLFLVLLGLQLISAKAHYCSQLTYSIFILFATSFAIACLTNAVQLTPFPPIDAKILVIEHSMHINMAGIVAWTAKHPLIKEILIYIYSTLPYQMSILPFVLSVCGYFDRIRHFCCLMLISTLIGFCFYYFFPTLAPASMINSPFFTPEQYATGIKFREIHQGMLPSTIDGGMIAMPSFHVIWAWLCLYLVKEIRWLFYSLILVNAALVASCVLLGWHYLLDVVGSLFLILLTHWLANLAKKWHTTYFPVSLMGVPEGN